MELALYCPEFGYYERRDTSPGRGGDFYTSVSVGPAFGEWLGYEMGKWMEAREEPREIVEAGAHNGALARDILMWMRECRPDLATSTEYWILEPSAIRRAAQEETLKEFGRQVRWFRHWGECGEEGVNGVIFSNELLDAFPAHRLGWDARERSWFEWGVALEAGELVWRRMPLSENNLAPELPEELQQVLPDGFTTERNPAAVEWWAQAAKALRAGKLVTIDYGLEAEEFFAPQRLEGTLRAYRDHQQSSDLLVNPGEQDLTAQVNFTAIREAGEQAGLKTEFLDSQGAFFTGLMEMRIKEPEWMVKWSSARARQFQTLTHPEHLGQKFRVLVQRR